MQYQTAYKSVNNGQSGQVTFDGYVNRANCYVDIGSSCDANEIQVEITHMELEVYNYYDYYEPYGNDACFKTIHFNWMKKDGKTIEKIDPQSRFLGGNHPSCNEHPFDYYLAVKFLNESLPSHSDFQAEQCEPGYEPGYEPLMVYELRI